MDRQNLQVYFFLGLIFVALVIVFFMFLPFLGSVVLATTFAVLFEPVYEKILKLSRNQRSVASLATILTILIIVFVPLTLIGIKVFGEAQDLYLRITQPNTAINPVTKIENTLEHNLKIFFPKLSVSLNLNDSIKSFFKWFTQNLGPIFSGLANILTSFLLSLLAIYYIFKDGARLKKAVFRVSPLPEKYNVEILEKVKSSISSVIKGNLIVAMSQGIVAGIGFTIFGVPNAALWGFVTVVAALVPIVGTSLVLAPVIIYLFLFDTLFSAIGLLAWSMLAVGLIDNLLGPKLIQKKIQVHNFLILLSVLGGISLFGPIGFLLGPFLLAFLSALLQIYPSLILRKKEVVEMIE
ncbi:MAG: AI-2E family transporter [Candidatus Liptonbacteria bacterium]|nr:AI-2E family transporter [Candidatus Liptonbacteria bacterium]